MNATTTWCRYLLLMLLVAIAPAAGALTLTGTIDATDPQMAVVILSPPTCASQGTILVNFEARPFYVTQSGTYSFHQTSSGAMPGFASLYLMAAGFDPNNGFPSCIAGSNGLDPKTFAVPLVAGTQYIAVPFDDSLTPVGGDYDLSITGAGAVIAGTVPGATAITVPTLSQWGLAGLAALLALVGLLGLRKFRRA